MLLLPELSDEGYPPIADEEQTVTAYELEPDIAEEGLYHAVPAGQGFAVPLPEYPPIGPQEQK